MDDNAGLKFKTRIKLCGLRRPCDVEYANELMPDYIGFVFAKSSKRYVAQEEAARLSAQLDDKITPVGVFVEEEPENIAALVNRGIIRGVQLHGGEDNAFIEKLKSLTDCMVIKAFQVRTEEDVAKADCSIADYVLLDSGGGTGKTFDWSLLKQIQRPYFLAGGLSVGNVGEAIRQLSPFGVDASSSLEKDGYKDREKMAEFVRAVRTAAV